MSVIPYLRVSGRGQIEGDGFDRQLEKVLDFCGKHNLLARAAVKEEGVSGTIDCMDRPAFSQMMADIAAGKYGAVAGIVVERMDRLARDLMVSEFMLAECRKCSLKVFCADRGELVDVASDGGDPTQVLIRQVMAAVAQWEKTQLVMKLAAARARIKATGAHCEGNVAYGTKPGEDNIARLIFSLRESEISFRNIAKMLNAEGFKQRNGEPWSGPSVHGIYHAVKEKYARQSEQEHVGGLGGDAPSNSTEQIVQGYIDSDAL